MEDRKLCTIEAKEDGIHIFFPRDLLIHVAIHHPEFIRVTNKDTLCVKVVERLKQEENDGSGLTKFQQIIDEAIYQCAIEDEGCEFYDPQ